MNAVPSPQQIISSLSSEFDLPPHITYLNCASKSPIPRRVEQVGIQSFRLKRLPYEVTDEDFFTIPAQLRQEFSTLINCEKPERIAILPSVSYGMAQVASNIRLSAGDEILLAAEQFPSNVYPWQKLARESGATIRYVSPPDSETERGKAWNQAILEAISGRTALVCIGNIHWADGTIFDLAAIRRKTLAHEALLIIDGTQSVGVMPMDVGSLQPDALICAGYKWLLGPYSIGVGYFGRAFDEGAPIEENWKNRKGSEDFAGLVNYQPQYKDFAARYEVGESTNFFLTPMLTASINMINETGPLAIQQYCRKVSASFIQEVQQEGIWVEHATDRASHLFGVRLPADTNLKALKASLREQEIFISIRGNFLRIAPHVYNHEGHFQKLLDCLRAFI
ncbi:MAG: aminotransferase class V-fold PLP-dependent enzyme [Bacteroidota bacterium]